jgi:DNA-directed RNA polymerase I and III subunit RPAC2
VVLNGNADVEFVGYSIPHPSEAKMNLRIQTSTLDTNQILNESLNTIQNISRTIKEKFTESLKRKK